MAEPLAQPTHLEFARSDACPDACPDAVLPVLPVRRAHLDAKAHGPASVRLDQVAQVLDKSVCPVSGWREDAPALPALAAAVAPQMLDSVGAAASNGQPDRAAAVQLDAVPADPLRGDFRMVRWMFPGPAAMARARCSGGAQSVLPVLDPWAAEPEASVTPDRLFVPGWMALRSAVKVALGP